MKKYIKFKLKEKKEKTNVYSVINISSGHSIGLIKWYGSWRQYCFFPNYMTIWNKDCLILINEYINKLMKERKKVNSKKVNNNGI